MSLLSQGRGLFAGTTRLYTELFGRSSLLLMHLTGSQKLTGLQVDHDDDVTRWQCEQNEREATCSKSCWNILNHYKTYSKASGAQRQFCAMQTKQKSRQLFG